MIDRQPPIDVYSLEGVMPEVVVGEIEFRNVDFAYPSRPDVWIFNSFSLCIPAGACYEFITTGKIMVDNTRESIILNL